MSSIIEKKFKTTTERFYEAVREEFTRMTNIKKKGKQVFDNDYIIAELAEKFFKAEKTIENIVFNRVAPKRMPKPVNDIKITLPPLS